MGKTKNEKHIVIAGMGFGGLAAAKRLSREHGSGLTVTLVNRFLYHQFNATLYEVATAWMEGMPEGCLAVLKRTNCVPVEQLLLRMPRIKFRHGVISAIDPKVNQLTFSDGSALKFDALIIALGSETDDMGIPGIAKYGIGLKTVEDAVRIRCDIETIIADAAQDKRSNRTVNIVVGGGGFSGTEFSAELARYAQMLARTHRFPASRVNIEIIEGSPHLLSGLDEWASRMAERRVAKLGIKTRLNTKVVQVTPARVEVSSGEKIPYDLLVWTGGVRANHLVRDCGLKTDPRGRLMVSPTLQTSAKNIFAVGDTVTFTPKSAERPLPWVAPIAGAMGAHAAANSVALLTKKPLAPFSIEHQGFVVPIGGKYALAVLSNGMKFDGFTAWVLRQFINLKYFLSILGPIEALRVWFSELTYYTKND